MGVFFICLVIILMKKVRCILAFIAIFVVGVFFGEKILASISLFDNIREDIFSDTDFVFLIANAINNATKNNE